MTMQRMMAGEIARLKKENAALRARAEEVSRLYEQLRSIIDGGSESMTHSWAMREIRDLQDAREENKAIRKKLEQIESFGEDRRFS